MQRVLILAPHEKNSPASLVIPALNMAGHAVVRSALDNGAQGVDELCRAFEGRPPDILLADLSLSADCLPLRNALRLLHAA